MRMRKYLILPLLLISVAMILNSCDTSTEPGPTPTETGSIFIQSTPPGAQIWVDGNNTNKTTPDSVVNLEPGSHNVKLTLDGYKDTTFTVDVVANFQRSKAVTLVSDLSVSMYGPVRIYETQNTTVGQASGIDLSSGVAYGVSGTNNGLVDIYYSTAGTGGQGYLVQSADLYPNLVRETDFYVGTGTNLNDGEDSPLATGNPPWTNNMDDREDNYVYLFDADLHYSKLKIVTWGGGGGPGDPAWVEVQWIYNNTANDVRF